MTQWLDALQRTHASLCSCMLAAGVGPPGCLQGQAGRRPNVGLSPRPPPCIVGVQIRLAVQRWTWRHVAATLGEPGFADGGFLEGALEVLRPARSSFGLQNSLISVITGAIPTLAQVREIQAGRDGRPLVANPRSPICLQDPGPSYGHMWWQCDLMWELRHQCTLPAEARPYPSNVGSVFFSRGLAPAPIPYRNVAPACVVDEVVCTRPTDDGRLYGTIYTDGSGLYTRRRYTARVGWGLATLRDGTARVHGALRGPLPLFTQSVGNGEIYAATMALRYAVPPIVFASDYQHFIDGWTQGLALSPQGVRAVAMRGGSSGLRSTTSVPRTYRSERSPPIPPSRRSLTVDSLGRLEWQQGGRRGG